MPVTSETISIVIAEDHEITRVGLRLTLEQLDGFVVVGEACNGRQAIQEVLDKKPKIVLMDIGLPLMDGIEATRRIKADVPDTGIIMLTSHDTDRDIFAALSAGADGYCVKEVSSHRLAIAIRAVVDGAAWLDPAIANRVLRACATGGSQMANSHEAEKSDHSPLSQREISVLSLIVAGLSNQEIAERLTLSVETVKTHVRHIMEKLAVHDRTQAAVKALRQGLV
ncbi:MAG: response regulator transcription factor [Candidatus Obscuribacterales bacterium]|nr:response regulator transcription factor [Candidatus Obscuribacterales bacterium]